MVPARGLWSKTASAAALDRTRLVCIEMVHGAAGSTEWGATQHLWSPAATGRAFDLGPSALSPLEPFRKYLTIVSDTDVRGAEALTQPEIGGDHFRSSAVFLTQAHPKQTESSDVRAGISLDQIYAQRFGQDTPIPVDAAVHRERRSGRRLRLRLLVRLHRHDQLGVADRAAADDPRSADGVRSAVRRRRLDARARARAGASTSSVLDYITGQVADLNRQLDASDRQRMERYLEDVREIERRIQQVEARNTSGEARELPGAPAGVPDSFDEHVKLMFDLQALAFQADVTRVFSFKMGRDASSRVYPESGVTKGFHPASHHGNKPASVDRVRPDQPLPRQPAAVLPGQAAVAPGRRRDACSTRA